MNDESKEEIYCNPWALKCHRDHLKKLGLLSSSHSNHSGGSNSPTGGGNNATQVIITSLNEAYGSMIQHDYNSMAN